jgi:hypothetical protein
MPCVRRVIHVAESSDAIIARRGVCMRERRRCYVMLHQSTGWMAGWLNEIGWLIKESANVCQEAE